MVSVNGTTDLGHTSSWRSVHILTVLVPSGSTVEQLGLDSANVNLVYFIQRGFKRICKGIRD